MPVQISIVLYNSDLTVLYTVLECAVLSCIRLSTVLYDGCWLCCIQLSTVLYSFRSTVLYRSRRCSLCCTTLDCLCCRLSTVLYTTLDCAVQDLTMLYRSKSRLCCTACTGQTSVTMYFLRTLTLFFTTSSNVFYVLTLSSCNVLLFAKLNSDIIQSIILWIAGLFWVADPSLNISVCNNIVRLLIDV